MKETTLKQNVRNLIPGVSEDYLMELQNAWDAFCNESSSPIKIAA